MSRPTRLARRRPFRRPAPDPTFDQFDPDDLAFTPDGLVRESYVEITLAGPIDPATGMILDLGIVDRTLARTLGPIERGEAASTSTELLAARLFEALRPEFAGVTLEKLRLSERPDQWVDVWP